MHWVYFFLWMSECDNEFTRASTHVYIDIKDIWTRNSLRNILKNLHSHTNMPFPSPSSLMNSSYFELSICAILYLLFTSTLIFISDIWREYKEEKACLAAAVAFSNAHTRWNISILSVFLSHTHTIFAFNKEILIP